MPSELLERLRKKFKGMMSALYKEKGAALRIDILREPEVESFIQTHADILDSTFAKAEMSDSMRENLQRSDYIFSGFKTFHEINESYSLLLDENGNKKSFNQFLNDVKKIDQNYNERYLRAEYNFASASSDMAAKWEKFAQDEDEYYLQYRTANDGAVRPEHAALHDVTLPASDSFWDSYYPPNGWNCRCTVVQVLRYMHEATPHNEAMQRGAKALSNDKKGMFNFNPGKQQKIFPDYNPYTISKCRNCTKAELKLYSGNPNTPLCQACAILRDAPNDEVVRRETNKKLYESLANNPDYRDVKYDEQSGGLKAIHIRHNTQSEGYKYELEVMDVGCKNGHSVILGEERNDIYKKRSTEGLWDGFKFEVASKETFSSNSIKNGLKHCASKGTTEYAVLYFRSGEFNQDIFEEGLRRYNGLSKLGDGQWIQFKKILCIQGDTILYDKQL